MRKGFRIGRFFGIEVRVDWSLLLIFLLITWNLGSVFSELHANWNAGLRWALAVVAALLFFCSVLAHEMAHSLVARARGIPIRNITLFLFGGVSNIERDPDSPQAEFVIAIVGPLTSLVVGAVLLAIATLTMANVDLSLDQPGKIVEGLGPISTMLLWLGSVNIVLGFFNLIPGFPLDGGRVLRSILWAITDNLRRATRWASWVGQGIAWLMIVAGIAMVFGVRIPFFGTGIADGLWLAFIGWFLNSASAQSYQQVAVQDILEGVSVTRMMRLNPPTTCPDCTVGNLVHEHIMGSDDHAFPVMLEDDFVGIVTLDDVREVPRERWEQTVVGDIMTPIDKLITVTVDEDAAEALGRLSQNDVRQLPVLREGRLVGLLRRRDIIRWLQLESDVRLVRRQ
jgi:Zn-dependent protease/predicted transcriptional regulator